MIQSLIGKQGNDELANNIPASVANVMLAEVKPTIIWQGFVKAFKLWTELPLDCYRVDGMSGLMTLDWAGCDAYWRLIGERVSKSDAMYVGWFVALYREHKPRKK